MIEPTAFDIKDGRNRYKPCPHCERDFGMGITSRGGKLHVWCSHCDHCGPAGDTDREAFDRWNAMPRDVMLTDRYTAWCVQEANRDR